MFTTLVLALTLGAVVADVSLGYQYKPPANPTGIPPYPRKYTALPFVPARKDTSFGKGSTGTFGQALTGSLGSSGQSSSSSATSFGQGSAGANSFTLDASGLYGPSRHGLNVLPASTKYSSSGTGVGGSNYNTFGSSQGSASSGSGSYGSGYNTNYNTVGSTGSSSNYNTIYPSNSGSNSNYNVFGSGSNYNIQNQQGVYQGSTFDQNAGFQGTYQTVVDTSKLDNIGNHYQAASAANQFISSNQYQNPIVQNYQEYYNQIQQQPAQVFKHYYVHAAPEDNEPLRRPSIVLPPPQKHYKVIFIKAPTQQAVPQVIPVPQQNEEKTIVYVLVKKPEDIKNIELPKFEPKAPTKPDVFFLKYNDKQDSKVLIDNIVNDYNKGGISASFSGISDGLVGSTGSGYKTGSSLISSVANANSNKDSGVISSSTLESVFGKNPNAGSPFGTSVEEISAATPSSTTFGSSSTLSPSGFSSVFNNRFGSSTKNNVVSSTSSSLPTSSLDGKLDNKFTSGSSYSTEKVLDIKPSVSFSSVLNPSSPTKANSLGLNSDSSSSYTSGTSSSFGTKYGSTSAPNSNNSGTGSSSLTSGFVSSSNINKSPSFTYGSGSSGSSSGLNSNSLAGTSYSFGSSVASGSPKPSINFGSSPKFPSTTVSSTVVSDSASYSSRPSSSSLTSGFTSTLTSGSKTSVSSESGSSLPTASSNLPLSSSISGVSVKPNNIGSSSSGFIPTSLSSNNVLSSVSSIGSDSSNSNSYSSGSTVGLVPVSSGSSRFGVGSSKPDAVLNSGSSISKSNSESSIFSTSQGIPHETYGVPKFKVL